MAFCHRVRLMCLSVRTLFALGSSKHKKSRLVITYSNGVQLMYMSVGMLDHVYVCGNHAHVYVCANASSCVCQWEC